MAPHIDIKEFLSPSDTLIDMRASDKTCLLEEGGKERLGRISKQGNRHLRSLLVAGAMAVIRYARHHGTKRLWLARLMDRRPIKVAAVALANKIARMPLPFGLRQSVDPYVMRDARRGMLSVAGQDHL